MSPELKSLYRLMQAWIDSDFTLELTEIPNRDKAYGLCWHLGSYVGHASPAHLEMKEQFITAGLDEYHPFNNGNSLKHDAETGRNHRYTNPLRLAWIKEHAK